MSSGTVTSDISGYNALIGASNTATSKKSTTQTATSQASDANNPMGENAFLTMLVAQLKNQDPLNPMQGSDFAAQLAQFSSVEQLFNVNDNLKSLQSTVAGKDNSNLLDYIGKEVTSEDNSMTLSSGKLSGGAYHLDSNCSTLIDVYDSNGTQVAQIAPGQQSAGNYQVNWNGLDSSGNQLPDGTYTYKVYAMDANGGYNALDTGLTGKITGVTYDQGTSYLLMGNQKITPSSVTKIWDDTSTSS